MLNLITIRQKFSLLFFCVAKSFGIFAAILMWTKYIWLVPYLVIAWIIFLLISVCIILTEKPEEIIENWWRYYNYKE